MQEGRFGHTCLVGLEHDDSGSSSVWGCVVYISGGGNERLIPGRPLL
ncbi:hypothetical protein [Streptomyces sp. NPDC048825]